MKMDKVAGLGNDNFYTPPYAIKPIMCVIRCCRSRLYLKKFRNEE